MLSSWLPQVYVAVFAISAYASTFYRAGSKPFNPVLGETYEFDRPDRGFRFIAEQVDAAQITQTSEESPFSCYTSSAKCAHFLFWISPVSQYFCCSHLSKAVCIAYGEFLGVGAEFGI